MTFGKTEKLNGKFGKMNFLTFFKNKRILITGHTGFKGSWLALWLSKLGADVCGYSVDIPTNPSLFEVCELDSIVRSEEGDVRNFNRLANVVKEFKPEIIFHLAAQSLVKKSYQNPVETFETNIMGTVNLLEIVRKFNTTSVVINVTSDKCYKNIEDKHFFVENDPMGGEDPYSASKGCAELVADSYFKSFFKDAGLLLASVRAGNVIGGGDWATDRLLPDCIRAYVNKKPVIIRCPDSIRPWQHVLDPLCGYLFLAYQLASGEKKYCGGWNFGPLKQGNITVQEIADKISNMLDGFSYEIDAAERFAEAKYLNLNCEKALKDLGWKFSWEVNDAVEQTLLWYQKYYGGDDMREFSLNQINFYEECYGN